MMAEGYYHLKDRTDRLRFHMFKLSVLAVVTEPLYDLCHKRIQPDFEFHNSLFTLLTGLAALIVSGWWKKKCGENRAASVLGCIVIVTTASAVSYFLRFEYDIPGALFIVLSYLYLCRADSWNLPQRLGVLLGIVAVFLFCQAWVLSKWGTVYLYGNIKKWRL